MPSIIKRGEGWQAQVCVSGFRRAKTFATKTEARRWAAAQESARHAPIPPEGRMTLAKAAERYDRERRAPGNSPTGKHIRYSGLADQQICNISVRAIENCRDQWISETSPQTAARYLNSLKGVLSWAKKKRWIPENPGRGVTVSGAIKLRERVPTESDFEALCEVAGWHEGEIPKSSRALVLAAFRLSMLTGMRGGEILAIEPEWIDGAVIRLPAEATKSRRSREVALGPAAQALLKSVMALGLRPRVFGVSGSAKQAAFVAMREKAGLGDVKDSEGRIVREALHFHDARAYFVTWCSQHGIGIAECCRQVGHSSTKMLMRYYRGAASDLAAKLK